jgi:hypothetical protein
MNVLRRYSLKSLRQQANAWANHLDGLRLDDRERFVEWLSQALDSYELALLVDSEVDRRSLWKIYLSERYGP